jgi:hypothetical protein
MTAADADAEDFTRRALAFAAIHVDQDTARFAHNLHSHVALLASGAIALPVTVDDGAAENAWVTSPRTTYADCAMEEAARAVPLLARPAAWLGAGLRGWLRRAGVDRVAMLNNWLLSTNLYPPLAAVPLDDVLAQARERWPGHALWFRSLNEADHADWIAALEARGFRRVVSRQVYLFDDWPALRRRHPDLRRDQRLLARPELQRTGNDGIGDGDYARIAQLYAQLYIGKYSVHNPHYTEHFMRAWHRAGLLELDAGRDGDGVLQCVTGMFRQGRTLTVPLVGYDTAQPVARGLYRRLNASAFEAAMARGLRLHLSAGAPRFKRMRGGRATLEFSLVCARDTPPRTRRAIAALSVLTGRIAAPLLRRYAL